MKIIFASALIAAAISRGDAAPGDDCVTKFQCADATTGSRAAGVACMADPECTWCHGMIAPTIGGTPSVSLKLGYCVPKDGLTNGGCAGAENKFGTLKDLYGASFTVKDVREDLGDKCPDGANDPANSLVKEKRACKDCNALTTNWCQIDTPNAHGGICLSNAKTSMTCEQLKHPLLPSALSKKHAPKTCPTLADCTKTTSCKECTDNCVWCGFSLENTKLTTTSKIVPGSGTQIGQCVAKSPTIGTDACAAVKADAFGTIAKTFEYKRDSKHEYKMVAKVLTTTNDAVAKLNGWASGADCKASIVDPLFSIKKTCKECTAATTKGHWCQTKKNGKAAGNLCLGKGAANAKAICDSFAKPAKSDAFYKVEVETLEKCDAAFTVASASSVALLAAVVAAFVSVA